MAIIYPLAWPTVNNSQRVKLTGLSTVGMSASPFSGQQQVYEWPAEAWLAEISMPPMRRAEAEIWISWLLSLHGRAGTFLFGDPAGRTPRGTPAHAGGAYPDFVTRPYDSGSKVLPLAGFTTNTAGQFKTGDYVQISNNFLKAITNLWDSRWFVYEGTKEITHSDPWGGVTAMRIYPSAGATNTYGYQKVDPLIGCAGRQFTYSIWLRAIAGTPSIRIQASDQNGANLQFATANLTTSWQRFFLTFTAGSSFTGISMSIGGADTWPAADGAIDIWLPSLTCDDLGVKLHKVLGDAGSDGNGFVTLDIFPRLHEASEGFAKVQTANAKGTFRLADNQTSWDYDQAQIYGISFKAVEAL